eukprot:10095096-Karenia_brevis.AAC.1
MPSVDPVFAAVSLSTSRTRMPKTLPVSPERGNGRPSPYRCPDECCADLSISHVDSKVYSVMPRGSGQH